MSGQTIRVLLADDHETVRQGLRLLIDSQSDMEVVGEVGTGGLAIACAKRLRPAVLVLDISMPDMSGADAARELTATAPDVAIVALTRHTDDAYVQALLSAGARAYVLKQSASAELLKAVREAAAGHRYLDRALTHRVATAFISRHAAAVAKPVRVSDRECEVLRLIARGFANKEIAGQLSLSVKTVEVHKANGMRKLELRGRVDIVRYAVRQGWLEDA